MDTKKKRNWAVEITISAFVAAIFVYLCQRGVGTYDGDNYWQLAHGRKMLADGLYTTEPLSMHEGLKFVYPQWLSVLLFTLIYNAFGVPGVDIWYRAIQLIGVVFVYKLVKMKADNDYIAVVLSFLFFLVYSTSTYATRPFVFSQTFIAVELYLLEKYIETKSAKYLAWLPFLSCAWINLHNSLWLFLYILMMPMIAEYLFHKWKKKDLPFKITPLIIAGAISETAALINPYGFDYILYLPLSADAVEISTNRILELNRSTVSNIGWLSFVIVAALIANLVWIQYKQAKKKENGESVQPVAMAPIRYWLLFSGTFVLALMHVRNITIFFIAAMPLISHYLARATDIVPKDDSLKRVLYESLLICFIVFSVQCFASSDVREIKTNEKNEAAVEYMEENVGKDAKVFATINSGGVLELYGYKPFVDTRLEVFTEALNEKNDYLMEYWEMQTGLMWPGDLIDKYDFDVFYIEKNYIPAMETYLANEGGFENVYEDDDVIIYKPEK